MRNFPVVITAALAMSVLGGCTGDNPAQGEQPANTSSAGPAPADFPPENDAEAPNIGRIRIVGGTHADVQIDFDPSLAERLGMAERGPMNLASSVTGPLADRLRAAEMDSGIFNVRVGRAPETNELKVRLSITGGRNEPSYRVALVARQGTSRWAGSLSRPTGLHPDYRGIADEYGRPTGNPGYESIEMDVDTLARRFAEAVELRRRGDQTLD